MKTPPDLIVFYIACPHINHIGLLISCLCPFSPFPKHGNLTSEVQIFDNPFNYHIFEACVAFVAQFKETRQDNTLGHFISLPLYVLFDASKTRHTFIPFMIGGES